MRVKGRPRLVIPAIAQTLGIKETAEDIQTSLSRYLATRNILLVLDNFEQVMDASTQIPGLLAAAPQAKVLVTSREPLRIGGEHDYAVPPLDVPEINDRQTPESLTQYEAVRLFVERAVAARADFAVTNENAPAVAEICFRLDGLPLAVELAAARVRMLPPASLLKQLMNPMKLLAGGARDLPKRQQTIRNTIAWSFELLSEDEKRLYRRLGIFSGGCTFEAAQGVCDGEVADYPESLETDFLECLFSLVDKSLVQQKEIDDEPRFVMLETIREFALERLRESGEEPGIQKLHSDFFLLLSKEAEEKFHGPQQLMWFARMKRELNNLRSVFARELEPERKKVEPVAELVTSLYWLWLNSGTYTEAQAWITEVMTHGSKLIAPLRLKLHAIAMTFSTISSNPIKGTKSFAEMEELLRDVEPKDAAEPLYLFGAAAFYQGDQQLARNMSERSVSILREEGQPWLLAYPLRILGLAFGMVGEYDRGAACFEESLTIVRRIGDKAGIAYALTNWAMIAANNQDFKKASSVGKESLPVLRELADKFMTVNALEALADVAVYGDNMPSRAVRLLGAAETLRHEEGRVLSPSRQARHDETASAARERLDGRAFEEAWDTGRGMTLEQAIAYALGEIE